MTLFETLKLRKARVLFVCLGNSCRSRMAETLANAHGSDVLEAESAGILPARRVSRGMREAMREKGFTVSAGAPRSIHSLDLDEFDLIVNLCHYALPNTLARIIKLHVADPAGKDASFHRQIRDEIEQRVLNLIASFHQAQNDFPAGWAVYRTLSPGVDPHVTSAPWQTYV